ncbi:zinc-binding dehydrogenase [Labedella populi]|uniref:zinc-binding dehydrogenase n=1 Tax=Labedella populi TaxID=2498850 RepID=UPI001409065E|nr:zinc-binding dehydrogenase [Labedella populi]
MATLPLDAVTARLVLGVRPSAERIFVNGVSGPVGLLIAQLALAAGATVVGTASERGRELVESLGVRFVDYASGTWIDDVLAAGGGPLDVAVDHRGDASVRAVVRPGGVVVRTAFTGRPGRERSDTALGALVVAARTHPAERVISSPAVSVLSPRRTSRILAETVSAVAAGRLRAPRPVLIDPAEAIVDGRLRSSAAAGEKLVVRFA